MFLQLMSESLGHQAAAAAAAAAAALAALCHGEQPAALAPSLWPFAARPLAAT
jgi:hypothetical protein